MADQVTVDRTRSITVPEPPSEVSRTRTIDEIVEEAGHIRNITRTLQSDVAEVGRRAGEVHERAVEQQLDIRAREIAKRPVFEMLNELADEGFSWRDVARLIGVSVPAIRKWRQGETPTGVHLLAVAKLIAFVETLENDHLVTNVPAWMEVPLVPGVPMTGIDLAARGAYVDLAQLAAGHARAEDLLDRWCPGWREQYRSQYEVFEAPDGELGIRFATEGSD